MLTISITGQVCHRRQVVNPKYAYFGSTRLSNTVRQVCDTEPISVPRETRNSHALVST